MTTSPAHADDPLIRVRRIFESMTFRERWVRIGRGLRRPRSSAENRYARLQLLRLWSPFSAVAIPLLVVALLMLAAGRRVVEQPFTVVMRPPEDEVDLLPPPAPLPRTDFATIEPDVAVPADPVTPDRFEPATVLPTPTAPPMPLRPAPRIPTIDLTGLNRLGELRGAGRTQAATRFRADARNEAVVLRALRWLKSQQRADGAWDAPRPAMTGLALMTYLAHNDTPASPEFGDTVRRAMEWLLANQLADGRFQGRDEHDYSQPIAAYALCEAFTMTRIPDVRQAAERAIDVILRGQHPGGGWDYNCRQSDRNDLSYSGWCVQALKAAQVAGLANAGLSEALERAARGVKRNASDTGGFGYTGPGEGPLTGVGVLSLQLLGAARDRAAQRGLDVMMATLKCDWAAPRVARPLYAWYYATQAAFHGGPSSWNPWNEQFSRTLIDNQVIVPGAAADGREMGYWMSPGDQETHGLVYNTTLCALMLQVYYRYLPTFEAPRPAAAAEHLLDDPGDITVELSASSGHRG